MSRHLRILPRYVRSGIQVASVSLEGSLAEICDYAFSGCIKLMSINYNGLITQWKDISKGAWWNESVPIKCIIHCTDGDVSI